MVEMEGGTTTTTTTTNSTTDQYAKLMDGPWWSQFRHGSNPWMARYVYGLMFLITNMLAWAVRDYGHTILREMESKIFAS